MIDNTFEFQLVLHKPVATYFPKDWDIGTGGFVLGRRIFVEGRIFSRSRNGAGKWLGGAGE
jgi:hypothetical protein